MVFGNNTTAAAFIGASVTLVLIIIFMILMVILVRQCLAFMAKRNDIRRQIEQHRQQRAEMDRQRRLSISEPVDPTFDWHHSIRIAGTPPPSYREAKKLPPIVDSSTCVADNKEKQGSDILIRGSDGSMVRIENDCDINDKEIDNKLASTLEAVLVVQSSAGSSIQEHVSTSTTSL